MPGPSTRGIGKSLPRAGREGLREGFTTGTAAAAAACAALVLLLDGGLPARIRVPLPPFADDGSPAGSLVVPVAGGGRMEPNSAHAEIVKDGGDDPDVTHGATIAARVDRADATAVRQAAAGEEGILLDGPVPVLLSAGPGVGRVTLPGLPVRVGEPAINPGPRRQIGAALALTATRFGYAGGLRVALSVPGGEELAKKTLNPRLGIVGGLSILGTHGIVKPYSHDAWKASIVEGLNVARAMGCEQAALSTGRRSERLLQVLYPDLPPPAFIQAADFAAFSLRSAADLGFTRVAWGCFFGKLIKLAQGLPYTHAHDAPLDREALALWCEEAGMSPAETAPLRACVTAGQALELLLSHSRSAAVLTAVAERARRQAGRFAPGLDITLHLFHINGKELVRTGTVASGPHNGKEVASL